MMKLAIENGRVASPAGTIYGGVAVEGEKIVFVGSNHSLPQAKQGQMRILAFIEDKEVTRLPALFIK